VVATHHDERNPIFQFPAGGSAHPVQDFRV